MTAEAELERLRDRFERVEELERNRRHAPATAYVSLHTAEVQQLEPEAGRIYSMLRLNR
jgi:hypothetical protein